MRGAQRDEPRRARPGRALAAWIGVSFLTFAGLLAVTEPAEAQVINKSKQGARGSGKGLPLVIGGGFEYQSDSEASESNTPLTLEYNFTEKLKLNVETGFLSIRSKSDDISSASGIGDLETFLEYEFLSERRYRPALTAEVGIKWPTAKSPDLGTGKSDYSLGLIASKEFVGWDADAAVIYTSSGDPSGVKIDDTWELSVAAEMPINKFLDLEAELVYSTGGGIRGSSVGGFGGALLGNGGDEFELAVGLVENFTKALKLEEGVAVQPDGSWQAITFLEYDFGGGD